MALTFKKKSYTIAGEFFHEYANKYRSIITEDIQKYVSHIRVLLYIRNESIKTCMDDIKTEYDLHPKKDEGHIEWMKDMSKNIIDFEYLSSKVMLKFDDAIYNEMSNVITKNVNDIKLLTKSVSKLLYNNKMIDFMQKMVKKINSHVL